MLKKNQLLALILFSTCLNLVLSYDHFRFSRTIDCQHQDKKGYCLGWSQTTTLYQYSEYIYYCFPGDLYVMTSEGPVQMKDLTTNDQVLSMNLQTGRNQFSSIKAWLHHDPHSLLEYSQIQVQNSSWKFLGSKYHNIAYSNQDQTDFKFLKDLSKNDTLISMTNTGDDFKIDHVDKIVEKEGLYSPMTQSGTFYIFPDSFNQTQHQASNEYPMILVHSLSQIKNPTKNINIAQNFIKFSQSLFGVYQPQQDEQYVNPLLSRFNLIFGDDWVNLGGQKIAHKQEYTYGSYSQTRNRRKEERKRKTMVVLAMQTILSDTLL